MKIMLDKSLSMCYNIKELRLSRLNDLNDLKELNER